MDEKIPSPTSSSLPEELTTPTSQNIIRQNSKLPLVIIGVMIILLVLVVGYFLNQKKKTKISSVSNTMVSKIPQPTIKVDETANWKTYTSKDSGFSFRYPPTWIVIEANKSNDSSRSADQKLLDEEIQKITVTDKGDRSSRVSFQIAIMNNAKNLSLAEIAAYDTRPFPSDVPPNPTQLKGEIALNGIPAKQYSAFGFDHQQETIVFLYKKHIYYIAFAESDPNDPNFTENSKIYIQILSTFKFL